MAESFVFNIAASLLGKLASCAYEEASRAYGVYEDLQRIKDTLSIVKGLLLDAEKKKDQQHALREWLRQIQNICSDAEDVLDGFELQDKKKQVVEASGSTRMKVRHFFSSSNPLVFRPKMAHQIKEIKVRLDKVAADRTKFGLVRIDVDPRLVVQRREMTHSHIDASSVIGRNNDRKRIVKLLKEPHRHGNRDTSLCVLPIVGIGGLGKTTLAKLVFNDKRMDQLFKLKMWVCVCDDFDIKQVIIKIINSASDSTFASAQTVAPANHENINNLDIEQLQRRLRHKISGQKFLLVLDDIWNDDRAKWIELIELIKVGATGSRVIVTTRSNTIALMTGTIPSYVLKGLSPKNCLSLFVKWAFKEGEEEKYPSLVEIGKEIVKKCQGVPLAVRTLGSSLFLKFDLDRWEFVRDHEIWNLEQKKDDILPALKLSYDEMPSYLAQCFACFSLYPKDYTFVSDKISTNWVALGLVHSQNIAREYIDELNSRSFLLDFEDFGYYCKFKVHDLVHDLALELPQLPSLETLLVASCESLECLPMYIFPKLQTLSIVACKMLNFVSNKESPIQKLKLKHLILGDFRLLVALPYWITGATDTLEVLVIKNFPNLEMVPQCLTTMTRLKKLHIVLCPQLLRLPTGIRCLTNLQDLHIFRCPVLCRKFQPQSGECWPMIAHVKHVSIGKKK
ncbi:hypothetical protein TSUD_330920 [Trifolium subterraneum]|nr:hypothetical protein TSUD_330920 [Trifolium subterraneum]